jgi:malonyl-CoA/methylmalonyl-CoA synthetase
VELPAANLIALFSASLRGRADKVGLTWIGEGDPADFTFGALDEHSDALAAGFAKLGVVKGDRLGLFCGNGPEFIITYLAHLKLGAITVPINVLYRETEIAHIVNDAEIKIITTDHERLPVLSACRKALKSVEQILVADGDSWPEAASCGDDPPRPEIAPDDLAGIIYTSGTTGRSKGAMLSHGNLMSNILALRDTWRLSAEDRFLLCLPLFHLHGLGNGVHGWLLTGMHATLMPRFRAEPALEALRAREISLFYGVPTMYARLLELAAGEEQQLDAMRLFVSGSAPLSAEMHQEFERIFGHRILERYGMTETAMITSNPYEGERRAGTVGLPLPGVELRMVNDEMDDVANGDVGQVALRGPNVTRGYWRDEEKTADVFRDGWFLTGDLATRSEDGHVTLVGRAKELIISGGFNVYPREIEDVICALEGVTECKCIGVADPVKGEIVKAYVVCNCEAPIDTNTLIAWCRERLASFKVPRAVQIIDALPRNAMGKVVVNELPDKEVIPS